MKGNNNNQARKGEVRFLHKYRAVHAKPVRNDTPDPYQRKAVFVQVLDNNDWRRRSVVENRGHFHINHIKQSDKL